MRKYHLMCCYHSTWCSYQLDVARAFRAVVAFMPSVKPNCNSALKLEASLMSLADLRCTWRMPLATSLFICSYGDEHTAATSSCLLATTPSLITAGFCGCSRSTMLACHPVLGTWAPHVEHNQVSTNQVSDSSKSTNMSNTALTAKC